MIEFVSYMRRATVKAAQRRRQVVDLRDQRLPWEKIGALLTPPVTGMRAHQIYMEALAEIPAAAVEQHRAEELALIDNQISDLLDIIRNEHSTRPRNAIEAHRVVNTISERKDRLLGLNMPVRSEVQMIPPTDQVEWAIEQLERQIADQREHLELTAAPDLAIEGHVEPDDETGEDDDEV